MAKDYYKILGVSKTASEEEIKKAFRRLAHEFHPDKAKGNADKFKEINEAYQVLSNKEKRAQYDRFGQVPPGGMPPGWENFQWGGMGDNAQWNNFEGMAGFEDIFESLFEQFGGRPRRQTYREGSDIEVAQELTLEEAFSGVKRKLSYQTYIGCEACTGLGYEKKKGLTACATCQGRGEVRVDRKTFFGNISQVKTCEACHGRGQIPNEACKACKGRGRILGKRDMSVEIAPGIEDGQIIKIKGAGEAGEFAGGVGDLYVGIRVKPHAVFERKRTDLFMAKDLHAVDALLGKPVEIKDISGERFHVTIPPGFNFKEKLKIPDRGMPRFGSVASHLGRGDLYISFHIVLPKSVSPQAKKLLEDLNKEF